MVVNHDDRVKRAEQALQDKMDAIEEREELEADEKHRQAVEDFEADEQHRKIYGSHFNAPELPSKRRKRLAGEARYRQYKEAQDEQDQRELDMLRGRGGK